MAKVSVSKKSKTAQMVKNLSKHANLAVGFFESAKYDDGTQVAQVAQVAFWQEYGTIKIPPRPFFRNAITKNAKKWVDTLETALKSTDGNFKKAFGILGEVAVGDIKTSITNLGSPPNAPSTIKSKKSSNPLIDTGLMRNSVTYEVS